MMKKLLTVLCLVGLSFGINVSSPALPGNVVVNPYPGDLEIDGSQTIGDPGYEDGYVTVNGTAFQSCLKVNDLNNEHPAALIVHKHSTTIAPIMMGARSNSVGTGHATVNTNQNLLSLLGAGWTGQSYDNFAQIDLGVDSTGTITGASNPGIIKFSTQANGSSSYTPIERARIDSTGNFRVGIASSNTIFDATGYMTATGSALGWDDVAYMAITSVRDTGPGSLTLATITGNITGWAFQINDYIPIQAEFSHRWKIGTQVSIHIHAMNKSTNAADRFMKFQLEYAFVDINGVVGNVKTISNNFTVPANAPINTAFYVELGTDITPPPSLVSAHIVGRLTRVTATGTAVESDPIVLSFGVHGQIDSLGSRTEYIK